MKIVSINDAPSKRLDPEATDFASKRKADLINILDEMRSRIESGEIQEFVATSLDAEGEAQIHALIEDVAVGVGLFEIGKNILLNQYNSKD